MAARIGALVGGLLATTIASAQFEGDPRLNRHVTLRFEANPLWEVLSAIKKQTGVEFSVARDISEDLVILLWRDKPATDVLRLIATHFGWSWTKTEVGYRLVRTNAQREAEERLRIEVIFETLQGVAGQGSNKT